MHVDESEVVFRMDAVPPMVRFTNSPRNLALSTSLAEQDEFELSGDFVNRQ
jgi:hypothetical protein